MEESPTPTENRPLPPSLLGLGPAWTRVGYGALALAILGFVLLFVVHPVFFPVKGQSVPSGYRMIGKGEGAPYIKTSVDGMIATFVFLFSGIAAFVWTLVDIVDRRKRFVWLLPMFICPFTGLHALPLALYLFFGRETTDATANVQ